jgi:hypothetical protein
MYWLISKPRGQLESKTDLTTTPPPLAARRAMISPVLHRENAWIHMQEWLLNWKLRFFLAGFPHMIGGIGSQSTYIRTRISIFTI